MQLNLAYVITLRLEQIPEQTEAKVAKKAALEGCLCLEY